MPYGPKVAGARPEFDEVIARIEQEPRGSGWRAGLWKPGIWDKCPNFKAVIKALEES
jgi:hypothetical protein